MLNTRTRLQESLEQFYEECRMLARAMPPEQNGPFFLGETFSLVDVALAPFWQRFLVVGGHYRGLQFPDKDPDFRRLRVRYLHMLLAVKARRQQKLPLSASSKTPSLPVHRQKP